MSWWKKYTAGGTGNTSSSSSSSSSSYGTNFTGDKGNQGGGSDASNFGSTYTGNQGNPSEAGSTVVNNKPDTSVPKQDNPYLYGGTTSEDLANVGFTGVGNPSPEDRKKESEKNPNYKPPSSGGTMTETSNDGTVAVTNFDDEGKGTTTITAPDTGGDDTTEETEEDIFAKLFGDENTTGIPDDNETPQTLEERRKAILKFKAQVGYNTLSAMNQIEADKIIAKIKAGEYFGSDFAAMQGTNKTGNELLAANNKSVADISEKDALALFKIAIQNTDPGTAREAGFSQTAEALLKSYVDSLSPADRAAFQEEARKIQDRNFNDPREELINIYTQPALLKKLTGLSTLNENQLAYDRLINEARRDRDSRSDTQTGQVTGTTSTQMGTDTTEQGENTGYGTLIGSENTTGDFVDTDGDGIDDRFQKGPNQPYEGPPRDPNKTTTPDPDVTTGATPNPNSFGNTALSGVYNLIPVKNRFTGQIEYIQAPVRNVTAGRRNFGSIFI